MDDDKAKKASELRQEYLARPSLVNYLRIRTLNPDVFFETTTHARIDEMFALHEELIKFGLSTELFANAIDGDADAISGFSQALMACLLERKFSTELGQTHVVSRGRAIGDGLVNHLLKDLIDAIAISSKDIRLTDLLMLIKEQLGGVETAYRDKVKVHLQRSDAIQLLVRCRMIGKQYPSLDLIGNMLGVNKTTVMRWFPDGDMHQQADELYELYKKTPAFSKTTGVAADE